MEKDSLYSPRELLIFLWLEKKRKDSLVIAEMADSTLRRYDKREPTETERRLRADPSIVRKSISEAGFKQSDFVTMLDRRFPMWAKKARRVVIMLHEGPKDGKA